MYSLLSIEIAAKKGFQIDKPALFEKIHGSPLLQSDLPPRPDTNHVRREDDDDDDDDEEEDDEDDDDDDDGMIMMPTDSKMSQKPRDFTIFHIPFDVPTKCQNIYHVYIIC